MTPLCHALGTQIVTANTRATASQIHPMGRGLDSSGAGQKVTLCPIKPSCQRTDVGESYRYCGSESRKSDDRRVNVHEADDRRGRPLHSDSQEC
jgi:hypothetical protein